MKFIKNFANREFSRFLIVGVTNTIGTFLVYILLLQVCPYLIAYSISFISGVIFSYYCNTRFVFKAKLALKTALQYPLVYVCQYLFGCLALFLFVDRLAINKAFAAIMVAGLSVPLTFVLSRLILKSKKETVIVSTKTSKG